MNQNEEKYDIVVDINSMKNLKEGWEIKYYGSENKINILKDKIRSSNKNFISVLGHSNIGKTYILQRICGEQLQPGITTKGISIKLFRNNAFLLDTVGENAPLLVEDIGKDPRDEPDFYPKQLDEINLCRIISNYFVQTFAIKYSDILLCIVGMLTSSEQQFLDKIKKFFRGKKLFVVHNLINCNERREVEYYINDVLKKSIIYSFKVVNIPNFEGDENNFNKYLIESDNNNILHFIMANDKDKNSQKLSSFNEPTIQFIRNLIDSSFKKNINLLISLVEHIKFIYIKILKKDLNEIKIVPYKNNIEKITYTEEINIKKVAEDEFGNINFIGKYYEPPFRYYKNENKFVIEIQLCCEIDDLDVKTKYLKENEEFLFIITGQKKIVNDEETNDIEMVELINNRLPKNFKVEFKIRIKDFEIDALKPIDKNDDKSIFMEYGILYINFNVE